jgi:pyridoxine 5-phosphate synthase
MHKKGILVSAFITPEKPQVAASADTGCDAIELHTGAYANAKTENAAMRRIKELADGKDFALDRGLVVHAGHGLTYNNIGPVAAIPDFCEFNIGHSIIARSVFIGIEAATAEMIDLIDKYSNQG